MPLIRTKSTQGFARYQFEDTRGDKCHVEKSTLAKEHCIWLGHDEIGLKKFTPENGWQEIQLQQDGPGGVGHIANTCMHLNRKQVRALLPILKRFVETGEI